MLIFGDYTCIPKGEIFPGLELKIFNLSSYVQNCLQLRNLLPNGVDCSSDENFDMSYFDYIYKNDYSFMEFMTIITQLYAGSVVYIVIEHTDIFDRIAESMAEIIKQRFGYLSYFVNEMEDYSNIAMFHNQTGTFSIPGLVNFDLDRQRYVALLYSNNMVKEDPENWD